MATIHTRAEPIFIQRPNGKCYRIDPPTRGQIREVKKLDLEDYDQPEQLDDRVEKQLRILVQRSIEVDPETGVPVKDGTGIPVDDLTGTEEREILWAVMAQHSGEDAGRAVQVHRALKKNLFDRILTSGAMTPSP